jgi:hypothetical protein
VTAGTNGGIRRGVRTILAEPVELANLNRSWSTPPHVLCQYEWSAAFPVSTKASLTITMCNRSLRVIVA